MTTITVNIKVGEIEKNSIIAKGHINIINKKHFSTKHTYKNLKVKYSWENMYNDVRDFVNSCDCNELLFEDIDNIKELDTEIEIEFVDKNGIATNIEKEIDYEKLIDDMNAVEKLPAKRRRIERATCFCG